MKCVLGTFHICNVFSHRRSVFGLLVRKSIYCFPDDLINDRCKAYNRLRNLVIHMDMLMSITSLMRCHESILFSARWNDDCLESTNVHIQSVPNIMSLFDVVHIVHTKCEALCRGMCHYSWLRTVSVTFRRCILHRTKVFALDWPRPSVFPLCTI